MTNVYLKTKDNHIIGFYNIITSGSPLNKSDWPTSILEIFESTLYPEFLKFCVYFFTLINWCYNSQFLRTTLRPHPFFFQIRNIFYINKLFFIVLYNLRNCYHEFKIIFSLNIYIDCKLLYMHYIRNSQIVDSQKQFLSSLC